MGAAIVGRMPEDATVAPWLPEDATTSGSPSLDRELVDLWAWVRRLPLYLGTPKPVHEGTLTLRAARTGIAI